MVLVGSRGRPKPSSLGVELAVSPLDWGVIQCRAPALAVGVHRSGGKSNDAGSTSANYWKVFSGARLHRYKPGTCEP